QRLRRDAAAVQAGATELVLLHERDLLAELGSAQRGRIAAAATAQDHDVELVSGCLRHLCAPRCKRVLRDPLGPGWPTAPPACPMLGHQATPSGPLVLISTRRGRYGSRRGAGGEVLEDLQDGAGAHAGGALAHVAQRC